MTEAQAIDVLRSRCGVDPALEAGGLHVRVPPEQWQVVAQVAKEALGCRFFNWLTAIDWKEKGLEVLCRLENLEDGLVITLRSQLAPGEVHCSSLTGLYRGANWMERECFDLLGVIFDGHPDLRRILLGDDWEGHPLRKDYAVDMPFTPYR